MAKGVNVEIKGLDQTVKNLASLAKNFKNFSTVFKKIAQDFRKTESSVFRSQGTYEGRQGWQNLSISYSLSKTKNYPGKPVLIATGAMRNSFTKEGGNHIEHISNDKLIIGSSDPKANYHQNGTSKMPARPPLTSSNTTNRRWVRIAHEEIMSSIKKGLI